MIGTSDRVPTAQGKQGKQGKWPKKSLSGKTQGIWKFYQNTGNLVWSSCTFPDSKEDISMKFPDSKEDISMFAVKTSIFKKNLDKSAKSALCM